jgi:hypothetical protein
VRGAGAPSEGTGNAVPDGRGGGAGRGVRAEGSGEGPPRGQRIARQVKRRAQKDAAAAAAHRCSRVPATALAATTVAGTATTRARARAQPRAGVTARAAPAAVARQNPRGSPSRQRAPAKPRGPARPAAPRRRPAASRRAGPGAPGAARRPAARRRAGARRRCQPAATLPSPSSWWGPVGAGTRVVAAVHCWRRIQRRGVSSRPLGAAPEVRPKGCAQAQRTPCCHSHRGGSSLDTWGGARRESWRSSALLRQRAGRRGCASSREPHTRRRGRRRATAT